MIVKVNEPQQRIAAHEAFLRMGTIVRRHIHKTLNGLAFAIASLCDHSSVVLAEPLEVVNGLEVLANPSTRIEGLHRLYVGSAVTSNLSFGGAIYSATLGDAGGAFFWGLEGVAEVSLPANFGLSFAGFVGGGGGASQVKGDGTMFRIGATLDYPLSTAWDLQLGVSWVRIVGAPINDLGYGIGLRHRFEATSDQTSAGLEIDGISVSGTQTVPASGTRTRAAGRQSGLELLGANAYFNLSPNLALSISAAGAARGGQGYMQFMGGLRRNWIFGPARLFAEADVGSGGGGQVDTGSGFLLQAIGGVALPVSNTLDVELSFGAIGAVTGNYRSSTATIGLVRRFHRNLFGSSALDRIALSTGILLQQAWRDSSKRYAGAPATVLMYETAFDLFLGQRVYACGSALTTLSGGVAGYAMGLLGVGYETAISDKANLSVEVQLGAAGGGNMDTAGGSVASLRAEIDYRINERWRLSLGVGQLTTLQNRSLHPMTLSMGAKMPFTLRN